MSIQTRKKIFVLAQMIRRPFLRFYNAFQDNEDWDGTDTRDLETLLVTGVTSAFLKQSSVSTITTATPDLERAYPDTWIKPFSGFRQVKVWEGTKDEKEVYVYGTRAGGSLVKKDLMWSRTPEQPNRPHPSGVIDSVITETIRLHADEIIDTHELTGLAVFPLFNERLYLCHEAGRNVDPLKDLMFDREIPPAYEIAITIISGGGSKENKDKILDTYFR